MSCWSAPGRGDKEDLPVEEVQEDDGEVAENLSGRKKSDMDSSENLEENCEMDEKTNGKDFKKRFPNLSPNLAEKMFSLTCTPCHEGRIVWDCELCLEMMQLDLRLSFDMEIEQSDIVINDQANTCLIHFYKR